MNYMAGKPVRVFSFFTSYEGESSLITGTPTEETATLRRVLDAAYPQAARLMVDYLRGRYEAEHYRQRPKREIAAFLTWLDSEQIGLMKATGYDLRRYFNGLTRSQPPETIKRQAALVQGFYHYFRAHL